MRPLPFCQWRKALAHTSLSRARIVRSPRWSQIRELQTRDKFSGKPQLFRSISQQLQRPVSQRIYGQIRGISSESQKNNTEEEEEIEHDIRNFTVPILKPIIWALVVSSGIYASLAFREAKKELEPKKIYNDYAPQIQWGRPAHPPTPTEIATRAWNDRDPMTKLSFGLIATNGVMHCFSFLAPRVWMELWHLPVSHRNWTHLTSTFVHGGGFHLAVNLWATYQFLPVTGRSQLFQQDTNHMLSFFLTAGIFSSLSQHMASIIFKRHPMAPFTPSGGASGALFAVLGVFCAQYPDRGLGLLFIPYYIEAQNFLPMIMLFDLYGMVRGYPSVRLAHAAHLGGAVMGAAYSWADGHKTIWRPMVNFWKRRLQN